MRLGVHHDRCQGGATGLTPEGVQRAGDLGRARRLGDYLSKLWATFRTRSPEYEKYNGPDTIERLGGRPPLTFAEFVTREKLSFPPLPGN